MLRILKFALILLAVSTTSAKAQDASAILNISVNLVQCGQTRADLPRACKADDRCCVFMDAFDQQYSHRTGKPDWKARLASKEQYYFKYRPAKESDI